MSERPAGAVVARSAQELRYAAWLERGTLFGFVLLVASFATYVFGWLPARVPPEQLPRWWGLPVADYLQRSGAPTGWAWVASLWQGDAAALLGIAWLAGCSLPCLMALVPRAWQDGERRFAWLCVAEVVVIALAASGWLAGGH